MAIPDAPARWSRDWWLRYATIVFLGQFKIPGWLGLLYVIFQGIPGWNSRFQFWVQTAKSTGGLAAPAADVLLWPYFPPLLALASVLYLVLVGPARKADPYSSFAAVFGWACMTAIILTGITLAGWGAINTYIKSEIVKGVTGVPRNGSPANPAQAGNEKPLFADAPRTLMPNQQKLLIGQSDILHGLQFRVSHLASDYEARAFAENLRSTLVLAGAQPAPVSEQFLGNAKGGGVFIEVPDKNSVAEGALELQRALDVADVHAEIVQSPGPYWVSSFALFVGSRPIQP